MNDNEISQKLEEPATRMLQLTVSLLEEIIRIYGESGQSVEDIARSLEHLSGSITDLSASIERYAMYLRNQESKGDVDYGYDNL